MACGCAVLRPSSPTTKVVNDGRRLAFSEIGQKLRLKVKLLRKSVEIRTKSTADSIGHPLDYDEADPDCIDASSDQFVPSFCACIWREFGRGR